MLLFILRRGSKGCRGRRFKYISCYCLSLTEPLKTSLLQIQIHLMLLFIPGGHKLKHSASYSNTSHVIVYLFFSGFIFQANRIQIHLMLLFIMIDSFDNSYDVYIQIHLMLLFIKLRDCSEQIREIFKYISCYCLSLQRLYRSQCKPNSNTSHVIVYQNSINASFAKLKHSNTSHVIVYHCRG